MITRARFQNFKALRDVTIDFPTPLTVFVGPNASGKSSVLQGISLASRVQKKRFNIFPVTLQIDANHICKSGGDSVRITFTFFRPQQKSSYDCVATTEQHEKGLFLRGEEVHPPLPASIRSALPSAEILRLDPVLLSEASYSGNRTPTLAANGAGLASVLAELATSDPAQFAMIQDALRTVIPAVRQLRLMRASVEYNEAVIDPAGGQAYEKRTGAGHKIHFDFKGADRVPAELASEGTLLVLGWLTAVLGQPSQTLLLIDDLDRALHPKAQHELVDILRRLLASRPELQILATSHSPYLLDKLKAEEVRLMTLDDEGVALCGTLMQHPEYERWKDVMLPGELWSTAGDAWLRERRNG